MNAYLKEIADTCGMKEELTFPYSPAQFCDDSYAQQWGTDGFGF